MFATRLAYVWSTNAYLHASIHGRTHACMIAYINVRMHASMHACMGARVYAWIHTWTHVCMHACMHGCMYLCVPVWRNACIQAYMERCMQGRLEPCRNRLGRCDPNANGMRVSAEDGFLAIGISGTDHFHDRHQASTDWSNTCSEIIPKPFCLTFLDMHEICLYNILDTEWWHN